MNGSLDAGIVVVQVVNILLILAIIAVVALLVKSKLDTAASISRMEKLLEEIAQNLKHHK